MKLHISVGEFYKLSKEQQRRLETWCFTHRYFTRLAVPGEPARFTDTKTFTSYVLNPIELSIGQMIEFLDDKVPGKWSIDNTDSDGWYVGGGNMNIYPKGSRDSLGPCDALWEAVVAELENQTEKD